MTTQDTGLVEDCARAAYEHYFDGLIGCAELPWIELPESHKDRLIAAHKAGLTAILPRLSETSQKLLRKELGDE